MCEGPNKNRHTKHCHCTPLSHTGSPADGPRWVLSSLLLGRIVAAPLISSHYTGGKKKKARKWESIAGNESHDADMQLQYTERVGQRQVVASSLTCCQVLQQKKKYKTTQPFSPPCADFTLCVQVTVHCLVSNRPYPSRTDTHTQSGFISPCKQWQLSWMLLVLKLD